MACKHSINARHCRQVEGAWRDGGRPPDKRTQKNVERSSHGAGGSNAQPDTLTFYRSRCGIGLGLACSTCVLVGCVCQCLCVSQVVALGKQSEPLLLAPSSLCNTSHTTFFMFPLHPASIFYAGHCRQKQPVFSWHLVKMPRPVFAFSLCCWSRRRRAAMRRPPPTTPNGAAPGGITKGTKAARGTTMKASYELMWYLLVTLTCYALSHLYFSCSLASVGFTSSTSS